MPGLRFNPDFERHLSLAALAHCPRDYWYVDQIRRGLQDEPPASDSLLKGLLVHVGMADLWTQRKAAPWNAAHAVEAMGRTPELTPERGQVLAESVQAVRQYADHWAGVRDFWNPIQVSPLAQPPETWTLLHGEFVAYPDLIVEAAPMYPILVVDHKSSRFKFEPAKWEYHPELLTQCLAAQKLVGPDKPVFYMIDYLQTPARDWKTKTAGNVWCFPATATWEFTEAKMQLADEWIEHGLWRRDAYKTAYPVLPWPKEVSQCQTPWGLCQWYATCFPEPK